MSFITKENQLPVHTWPAVLYKVSQLLDYADSNKLALTVENKLVNLVLMIIQ